MQKTREEFKTLSEYLDYVYNPNVEFEENEKSHIEALQKWHANFLDNEKNKRRKKKAVYPHAQG